VIRINLLTGSRTGLRLTALIGPQRRATVWGLLLMTLTGTGVTMRWHALVRHAAVLDARIVRAQSELLRLTNESKIVDRAVARKSELASAIASIDRLRAGQKGPVTLLAALSRSLPDGLWLIALGQQGDAVQIDGRAMSLSAVSDFVERLQASAVFVRPVALVSTGTELLEDSRLIRFSVKAQLITTGQKPGPVGSSVPKGD